MRVLPLTLVESLRGGTKPSWYLLGPSGDNSQLALATYNAGEHCAKRNHYKTPAVLETRVCAKQGSPIAARAKQGNVFLMV